ncbi:hypothetical protein B0H13DRAFT_2322304 [Mycena leptocephala]|nr:hypothetical protein B0H13DRAFT_2322304 [Mycena leptocephala]
MDLPRTVPRVAKLSIWSAQSLLAPSSPHKFHQYIVPSIRRVYIDMSRHDGLRKKLSVSEARVRALEKDKERLMAECERHIAAADAHGRGETDALRKAKAFEDELELTRETAALDAHDAQEALCAMKIKYDKMKRLCRSYTAASRGQGEENTSSLCSLGNGTARSLTSLSTNQCRPNDCELYVPCPDLAKIYTLP